MIDNHLSSLPESVQNYLKAIIKTGLAKKLILFGSRARGDHRENSDFDIAVEWGTPSSKEVLRLIAELNEQPITLQKIDLLNYNEASPGYIAEIKKEGKVLWVKKD